MRIDCIIQSTGYHDMLALTLPQNLQHFDSVTVYTKVGDEATKEVCAKHGVACIETSGFTANGSKFNRGKVYNESFLKLLRDAQPELPQWVSVLDSDIILPRDFRARFEELQPDEEHLYGARRYNVETQEQYEEVARNPAALDKLTLFRGYGYGYLQLFSMRSTTFAKLWNATGGNPYPEWQDGSTADWMFRNIWGHHDWNPPTQPPDHALDHSVPEPCDPPVGLLLKLPFNVVHIGVTGMNNTCRKTPLWNVT